jgi:hypothetical protein
VKSVLKYTKQSTLHGVVFDILAALPVLPRQSSETAIVGVAGFPVDRPIHGHGRVAVPSLMIL